MRPVILLTGKNGQLGGELLPRLRELGEVAAPDRGILDLSKPDAIRRIVQEVRPQLIVNAAAYTEVDGAETDRETARRVNAEAPGVLAEEAKQIGAALVHYSTDYVFDGAKLTPYDEADSTNPLNVYGKTKLAGEEAIRISGVPHLIFRTSWVYATRGKNFMLTILRLATEREELKIVGDQVGAPTCAPELALATCQILAGKNARNGGQFVSSDVSGTYHMTAAGQTTWFEFAQSILEQAKAQLSSTGWLANATRGQKLIAQRLVPISTAEFNSPALRPRYSVLSNLRLTKKFGISLPDWRAQLERCFEPGSSATNLAAGSGVK